MPIFFHGINKNYNEIGLNLGTLIDDFISLKNSMFNQLNNSKNLDIGEQISKTFSDILYTMVNDLQRLDQRQIESLDNRINVFGRLLSQLKRDEIINTELYDRIMNVSLALKKQHTKMIVENKKILKIRQFEQNINDIGKQFIRLYESINPLKFLWNIFMSAQNAMQDFRRSTGFTIKQTQNMQSQLHILRGEYAHLGLTLENITGLYSAFANEMKDINFQAHLNTLTNYGESLMTTYSIFMSSLGALGGQVIAKSHMVFSGFGKLTDTEKQTALIKTLNLTNKWGTSFAQVMGDVANASEDTLSMLRGNVVELIKSANRARIYGIQLQTITRSASNILNFEQSISSQMQASVMLGKRINLNRARELAFLGKHSDLADQINNIVQQIGRGGQLNVYQ